MRVTMIVFRCYIVFKFHFGCTAVIIASTTEVFHEYFIVSELTAASV